MKTWKCACGNTLFFGSRRCVQCEREVGICPACRDVAPLGPADSGENQCGCVACGTLVKPCGNNQQHGVCNGYTPIESDHPLCDYCRLNAVIPDLSMPDNLSKWNKLEAAKRRVLYVVESIGLPLDVTESNSAQPQLSFAFVADAGEPVPTGHLNGRITINIREADDVEREKARVRLGEPQRTLVGHFRHELGHYYWDRIVKPERLSAFRDLFGDERDPSYQAAQQRYYNEGPRDDWSSQFLSAYASMHPWEDFAETFNAYLDMASLLATADHFQLTNTSSASFAGRIDAYRQIGVVANELARDMGLVDLVPEVLTAAVVAKLEFVHGLAGG